VTRTTALSTLRQRRRFIACARKLTDLFLISGS